jgi:hypothetical protein
VALGTCFILSKWNIERTAGAEILFVVSACGKCSSGLNETEESELGFPFMVFRASLAHAHRNYNHRLAIRSFPA